MKRGGNARMSDLKFKKVPRRQTLGNHIYTGQRGWIPCLRGDDDVDGNGRIE